jgi:hypothetical protein
MEKSYPAVNKRVYCGAGNCALSDEHIMPYFLGGVLVLPKASCEECQKIVITSNIPAFRTYFRG